MSVYCTRSWIYVSNAETSDGGVGAITFNSLGKPIRYRMIMTGTSQNCGGGKTYWGTWVSCEEHSSGQGKQEPSTISLHPFLGRRY